MSKEQPSNTLNYETELLFTCRRAPVREFVYICKRVSVFYIIVCKQLLNILFINLDFTKYSDAKKYYFCRSFLNHLRKAIVFEHLNHLIAIWYGGFSETFIFSACYLVRLQNDSFSVSFFVLCQLYIIMFVLQFRWERYSDRKMPTWHCMYFTCAKISLISGLHLIMNDWRNFLLILFKYYQSNVVCIKWWKW